MTINRLIYDKRFFLLSAMLASLTSYFWLASRYPALNQKALMGGNLALEDGLSFDAWFLPDQVPEWLPQFILTFINWLHTNQNGMLFGLCFAVIVMSLLSVTRQYLATSSHPFWSTIKGFLLGAPLGVCVNCAAPIAYGMYRKGVRAESALAMMISSPTLNVIVISMALALLPLHLVVIKLVTTLALTILLAGVVAGVASQLYHDRVHIPFMVKSVFSIPLNDAYPRHRVSAPQPAASPQPLPAPMTDWREEFSSSPQLKVASITLEPDTAGEKGVAQAWRMRLIEDAGFRDHPKAVIEQLYEPLSHINGVSSADVNRDGWIDLLVGNDYDEPDVYYRGGKDGLRQWDRDTLPYTTRTSMSIDSADIDNDLVLETYHVQIAEQGMRRSEVHGEMTIPYTQEQCRRGNPDCELLKARNAMRNRKMKGCTSLEPAYQKDCVLAIFNQRALQSRMRNQEVEVAKYFERSYRDLLPFFKKQMLDSSVNLAKDDDPDAFFPRDIRQKANENMLFFRTSDGYRNEAESYGVANPGWGWNGRFFDLDGDGFQDLYVVNGGFLSNLVMENIWYRNWGGRRFVNTSAAVGLNDMEITLSYSSFDADNDGDLDLVTFTDLDHLKYYENVNNSNHHLQIQLDDEIGNRSGIGAKITIFYGENNELHQMRELKASGGYMSFDAPIAHFGLG